MTSCKLRFTLIQFIQANEDDGRVRRANRKGKPNRGTEGAKGRSCNPAAESLRYKDHDRTPLWRERSATQEVHGSRIKGQPGTLNFQVTGTEQKAAAFLPCPFLRRYGRGSLVRRPARVFVQSLRGGEVVLGTTITDGFRICAPDCCKNYNNKESAVSG